MRSRGREGRRGVGLALLAGLALAGSGCAARGAAAGEADAAGAATDGRRAVARIVSRVRTLQTGSATIRHDAGSDDMTVSVALQGSPSNNVYAWRVTSGTCGVSGGALIGDLQSYPVIQVQADGTGRASAQLPADRPSALSVRIYESPAMRQQIACGDFR